MSYYCKTVECIFIVILCHVVVIIWALRPLQVVVMDAMTITTTCGGNGRHDHYHHLWVMDQLNSPPGERRISEISPPLLSGSELYKNLSFSRPMSIFCLLDPLLSLFTKLSPFFTAFIFLLFFVQVQSSANQLIADVVIQSFVWSESRVPGNGSSQRLRDSVKSRRNRSKLSCLLPTFWQQ